MPNQPTAQPTDVNMSKQNINANQNMDRQNIETAQRSGTNEQSANVTGSGETSRSAYEDDIGGSLNIGNPKAAKRSRETGRADTDMNSDTTDTMGGDLSSDR